MKSLQSTPKERNAQQINPATHNSVKNLSRGSYQADTNGLPLPQTDDQSVKIVAVHRKIQTITRDVPHINSMDAGQEHIASTTQPPNGSCYVEVLSTHQHQYTYDQNYSSIISSTPLLNSNSHSIVSTISEKSPPQSPQPPSQPDIH